MIPVPPPAAPAKAPLVTVGLPLYNSARQLRQAMDSLLGQTLSDFEIVISDNASTDGTAALCEEYVRADPRVRYIRQARNIGAPRNWNAVVHAARGEYFKWASGNDYYAPETLARAVEILSRDPGAAMVYGRTALVDDAGRVQRVYDGDMDFSDPRPSDRLARVRRMEMNNAQQGVVRTAVMRRTGMDRMYPQGDKVLIAELALYGRCVLLPEVTLYRRQGVGAVMAERSPEEVQRIYNPFARRPMKIFRGRFHGDLAVSIARAPIPFGEKLRAWGFVLAHARAEKRQLLAEFASLFKSSLPLQPKPE